MHSSERFTGKARTPQAACSLFKFRIISLLIENRFQLLITPTEEDDPICKALDPLPGRANIVNEMFMVFLCPTSTSH